MVPPMNDTSAPASSGFWNQCAEDFFRGLVDIRRYAALSGRGLTRGFQYLLLLSLLCAAVDMAIFSAMFFPRFARFSSALIAGVESVSIRDGVLSSPVKQPFSLGVEGVGTLIIDTTGATAEPAEGQILVTAREILSREASGAVRRDSFSSVKDLTLDRAAFERWKKTVELSIVPLVGSMTYLSHLVRKALFSFVLFLIGFLYVRLRRFDLDWQSVWTVALYALSAPVALYVLVRAVGIAPPFFALFSLLAGMIYLLGGLSYCGRVQNAPLPESGNESLPSA